MLISVSPIGLHLNELVYSTQTPLDKFDLVLINLRGKEYLGVVSQVDLALQAPSFTPKPASKSQLFLTKLQKELLEFTSKYYLQSLGNVASIFHLDDLKNVQKGSLDKNLKKPLKKAQAAKTPKETSPLLTLSQEQEKALRFIESRPLSLLFGDTSSGKSEIYFHLIDSTLKSQESSQCLLLMPEISLTPLMEKRLQKHFGDKVAMWHSKITKAKKQKVLDGLKAGSIKIIIGARSALFLPWSDLRLIIVDEEHDDSFKSQTSPKYNARDLCVLLSQRGIKVVLGSATPSLKSYYLAKEHGYLYRLKGKFFNSQTKLILDNSKEVLSPLLLESLQAVLDSKKQAIIFLPTRANFKSLLCTNCASTIKCPHCQVSLSVNFKKNSLVCHYCNYHMPIPLVCPTCGSEELRGKRLGTEELKNTLEEIFTGAKIKICDRDNASSFKELDKILSEFSAHKFDFLIGTQMLSKGHDFKDASLSVILGIDHILGLSDYRASEKAFSLLFQIAGRSGRRGEGSVLIQSLNTSYIEEVFKGGYQNFLENELLQRANLYPPFVRLAKLTIKDKNETKALMRARYIKDVLSKCKEKDVEVIGLAPSSMPKLKDYYFFNIILRCKKATPLLQSILSLEFNLKDKLSFDIDIDPIEF
ncbi:primosomal protein N' [Helicobacter sp. 11S02629-2]|uniref:replication restart helicase PriA n=1 Tax=Helicobacter sp. 11S02629-2 TaxID=1476195 RepID=UPI000BA71584|nr:primosomal protein N' [Helicobacter sp. 11S02629-2]PAF45595.1 primosomal protein N' [Helicobacter sp. 11S02629-2]